LNLSELGILPFHGFFSDVMLQKYVGDITLVPR
jgi:hypothetical protein